MEAGTQALQRLLGMAFMTGSLWPLWRALQHADRREFVATILSCAVGWLVLRGGIELLKPESAE